jgi:hypothetical protein
MYDDDEEEDFEFVIQISPEIGEQIAREMRLEREAQKKNEGN